MYGNKSDTLQRLSYQGFLVPKFFTFSEEDILEQTFFSIAEDMSSPFILRSSYSIEDGSKNAFAGIFESYFPVVNEETFQKGMSLCLGADGSDKFLTYIKAHAISTFHMKKNIIVQEFITGDFSGVCFTKDSKSQMIIEIIPGINFPLVQGSITYPFSIVIPRNDISQYTISNFFMDKFYYTLSDDFQEVSQRIFDIRDFEEKILLGFKNRLVHTFLKIEKLLGGPQDIEFTVKGEEIYILQSRDITTL